MMTLATCLATQYAAYRLRFDPALGPPLLRVWGIGPLYAPPSFFVWWWRFGHVAGTATIWRVGLSFVSGSSSLALLVALVMTGRRARALNRPADTHGSARWAQRADLEAAELIGRDAGVYIGAWQEGRTLHYLRHSGPQHVLAFAPSRSGKGVGLVVPTLLTWPASCVVNDVKGENWALTAGWRRRELGSVCLKFDPTAPPGSAARYNPLLEVRPWPHDVRDAQLIADMLVEADEHGTRDHWDLTAHDLLVGVILHTLYAERDKTLYGCLTILADPTRTIEATMSAMLRADHDPDGAIGWTTAAGEPTRTHPAVAGAARALLNKSDNERSSVVSSAVKFLNLYRDPIVIANTATSDFAVRDLMPADVPVSLYLTTPPADIHRTRPLLRLLLHQIVSRLTETMDITTNPDAPATDRRQLLLMLDEFPALGRMDVLQTALAYLPGYGIKAYLIVQDVAQLAHAYGRYESIVSNCHVRTVFAANRVETAKLISDMAGTMTVHKTTRTYGGSRANAVLMHVTAGEQETARALLTPDEVMRLPDDVALIFVAGQPPIYGRKIRYYVDPVFRARAAISPPARSDRLTPDWTHWRSRVSPSGAVTHRAHTPDAPAERLSGEAIPDGQMARAANELGRLL